VSEPVDTASMRLERRISAVYKDIPGGQMLGPTYDYTHRLLISPCWPTAKRRR
jgi:alpha-D-ribose 1-methylphosphonate 5-triphosphate synthase subunit PhnI